MIDVEGRLITVGGEAELNSLTLLGRRRTFFIAEISPVTRFLSRFPILIRWYCGPFHGCRTRVLVSCRDTFSQVDASRSVLLSVARRLTLRNSIRFVAYPISVHCTSVNYDLLRRNTYNRWVTVWFPIQIGSCSYLCPGEGQKVVWTLQCFYDGCR